MQKSDILETLRTLPYDPAEYWVITGGAMVLYGFREQTHDVDLGCTTKLADELEAKGFLYRVMDDGNRWFKLSDDVEVFENWLYDTVVSVEGVPVISIPGLLAMKQALGREKDLRDIRLIRERCGRKSPEQGQGRTFSVSSNGRLFYQRRQNVSHSSPFPDIAGAQSGDRL